MFQPNILAANIKKIGGDIWENLNKIYAGGNSYIASFAPLVFETYGACVRCCRIYGELGKNFTENFEKDYQETSYEKSSIN